MADVKKCDRCGSIYNPQGRSIGVTLASVDSTSFANTYRLDLCEECRKQFDEWLVLPNMKFEIKLDPRAVDAYHK